MLADDLAQEALARGLARIDQLREAERLSSWLFSILHRCWIDHLRGRRDDLDEEALAELPASCRDRRPGGSAGNGAAGAQPPSQALPLGQRQVVTLVDLEEFTYAEVAEVLAIPIGTVMSRLCRAREALRGLLEAAAAAAAPEEREMNDKRKFFRRAAERLRRQPARRPGERGDPRRRRRPMPSWASACARCAPPRNWSATPTDASRPPAAAPGRRGSLWSGALAAGLALAAGVLIGWQGHRASQEGGEALATLGGLFAPQPARVLIHLDNSQTERMEQALDLAEAYLAKAGRARVEIVVNNSGLDLLREESTFHAERIARAGGAPRDAGLCRLRQRHRALPQRRAGRQAGAGSEGGTHGGRAHRRPRAPGLDLPEDLNLLADGLGGKADAGKCRDQAQRRKGEQHLDLVFPGTGRALLVCVTHDDLLVPNLRSAAQCGQPYTRPYCRQSKIIDA
jgi:RNA polymerase sigma-70 factor (ECF subfamily)